MGTLPHPTRAMQASPPCSTPLPPLRAILPLRVSRAVSTLLHPTRAMLALIRLTNAAAQLPCGSGETQGDASPPCSTPLPPLRAILPLRVSRAAGVKRPRYRAGVLVCSDAASRFLAPAARLLRLCAGGCRRNG